MLLAIGLSITTPVSVAVMSLPPMRRSSKYECGLLLFLAVVIFPTVRIATGTDARSQPATVAKDAHAITSTALISTLIEAQDVSRPITGQPSVVSNHNQKKIMEKILITGAVGS